MIELVDMTKTISAWVVRKPNGGINSYHYAKTFRTRQDAVNWIQEMAQDEEIKEYAVAQ